MPCEAGHDFVSYLLNLNVPRVPRASTKKRFVIYVIPS